MTLIEKTLKENIDKLLTKIASDYTNYNIGVASIFERLEEELPKLLTQALQEQDRESSREILKGIETYWNDNNYDEISSGGLIKHLGIDLKQDETKGSFAVWTPEIKEHANQVKEIIENREKHEN